MSIIEEGLRIIFSGRDQGLTGMVRGVSDRLTDLNHSASAATSGIKSFAEALGVAVGGGSIVAVFKAIVNQLDDMADSAQKVGLTVEQLSALAHAADSSGVSFENLQNGLQKFAKRLAESATGTDKASKLMRALGIDASQGTLPAFERLADVFASTEDGAAKVAASAELIGQRMGPELIPLLNSGSDGIRRMMEEAKRLGLVMTTDASDAAGDFNDGIQLLNDSIHGLLIEGLGPTIKFLGQLSSAFLTAAHEGTGLAGAVTNLEASFYGLNIELTKNDALNLIGKKIGTIKTQLAEIQGTSGGALQQGANWIERTLAPTAVGQKVDELKGKLKDLEVERQKVLEQYGHSGDAVERYEKRIADLKKLLGELGTTHHKTGAAVKDHTKEIKNQEKATLALAARYGSSVAQQEVYRQKLQEVTEAMQAQGATAEELAAAQKKVYQEVFGDKATKQVDAWATITKQALKRVDDSFVTMWKSVISGTGNAMDSLKSLVTDTLAEIAHELITKKLVVSIGAVLGVNSAGAAAWTVGTTGGSGSSLGLLSSFGNMLTGTSIGGGIANTLFDAGSLAGIAPDTLANGLSGIAGTSNLAFGISGIAGALVGHFLAHNQAGQIGSAIGGIAGTLGGSALSGTIAAAATSAAGAAAGAAAGSVVPVVGTIIGAAIGALAGNAFGGVKIPEVTVAARGGGIVPVSGHNLSQQQYTQAINTIDAVNQLVTGLVGAFGPEGQKAVAAVNLSGTKSGPGDLNAEAKNLLKTDILAAAGAGDQMAQYVADQLGDFNDSLEDTANEIGKAVAEFQALQQIVTNFDALGVSLGATDEAAIAAAKHMAEAAGGVSQLASAQAYYAQNVLSDTDRLTAAYQNVQKPISDFNSAMGLSGDSTITTTNQLKAFVDGLDLTTSAGQDAYVAALQAAPAIVMASDALGKLTAAGKELDGLADTFRALGESIGSTSDAARKAVSDLADLAGGTSKLSSLQSSFQANFFSEAERYSQAEDAITAWNESVGLAGDAAIRSKDQLRSYIQSLDLTTEAGRKAYISAMEMADTFVAVADYQQSQADAAAQAQAQAAQEAAKAAADAAKAQAELNAKLSVFVDSLGELDKHLAETDDGALSAASRMSDLAGGIDALTTAQAFYQQHFYSSTEQSTLALAKATRQIDAFNEQLGLGGETAVTTKDQLRDFVDSLDLTTSSGQSAYVAALQAAPALQSAADALDQLGQSASSTLDATRNSIQTFVDALTSIQDSLDETRQGIEAFGLTNEELYKQDKAQADALAAALAHMTDPAQIEGTVQSINALINDGWQQLSDEQKAVQKAKMLSYIDEVEQLAEARLGAGAAPLMGKGNVSFSGTLTDFSVAMGNLSTRWQSSAANMESASGQQMAAAQAMIAAAANMSRAASAIPTGITVVLQPSEVA